MTLATIGSRQSVTEAEAVPLASFARELEARRARLATIEMPRNSGERRTPSKRALLAAIERVGGKW